MSRDSSFSYLHLKSSHHVLYINNWVNDKIPYDNVDIQGMNFDDEDDQVPLQNAAFGAIRSNKRNKQTIWKDFELKRMFDCDKEFLEEVDDGLLLKKIQANERLFSPVLPQSQQAQQQQVHQQQQQQQQLSTVPEVEITTPELTRTRAITRRNLQNYQTPIGRVLR